MLPFTLQQLRILKAVITEKSFTKAANVLFLSQPYLSKQIKDQIFWPKLWCQSFKHNLLPNWPLRIWQPAKLPKDTSIVAFTGKPDPGDVINGKWPIKNSQIYKKLYKQLKTPKWVVDNWN